MGIKYLLAPSAISVKESRPKIGFARASVTCISRKRSLHGTPPLMSSKLRQVGQG